MRRMGIILILLLSCAGVTAQDDLLEQDIAEDARQYTIEIIVFSYEENVSVGTEVFVADQRLPNEYQLGDAIGLGPESPLVGSEAPTSTPEEQPELVDLEFVRLPRDEFTLTKAGRQFDLLDVYETIMHVGWTQPTYPEEVTPSIELRMLGNPPAGLDGTFTLYLSRYLHLVVDLALDAPNQVGNSVDANGSLFRFGDSRGRDEGGFGAAPEPVRYRIQENRILKNGEIRYFDHPKFGVLAKVTRVEENEDDANGQLQPLAGGTGQ